MGISLSEALSKAERPGRRLLVDQRLAELADHPDLDQFMAMLSDPEQDSAKLSRVLTALVDREADGYVSEKAVANWRRTNDVIG